MLVSVCSLKIKPGCALNGRDIHSVMKYFLTVATPALLYHEETAQVTTRPLTAAFSWLLLSLYGLRIGGFHARIFCAYPTHESEDWIYLGQGGNPVEGVCGGPGQHSRPVLCQERQQSVSFEAIRIIITIN